MKEQTNITCAIMFVSAVFLMWTAVIMAEMTWVTGEINIEDELDHILMNDHFISFRPYDPVLSSGTNDFVECLVRKGCTMVTIEDDVVSGGKKESTIYGNEEDSLVLISTDFGRNFGPGLLISARAENALWGVSERYLQETIHKDKPDCINSILHVITKINSVGGHSSVAKSFFEFDVKRRQVLFFDGLWGRGYDDEGEVYLTENKVSYEVCLAGPLAIIECARQLRSFALDFDLVVLHTHPQDPIPALAFGHGYHGPPVAAFDHTDIISTFGYSVIDFRLVYSMAEHRLVEARGLSAEQDLFMPLSARFKTVSPGDKAQIRRDLGFSPDEVVILTCASPKKYGTRFEFLNVVISLLKSDPRVRLVALGVPTAWGDYVKQAGINLSQVIMHSGGHLHDSTLVHMYHAAADIHLDSFPYSSHSSAIESGLGGAVIVNLCPWENIEFRSFCLESEDYGYNLNRPEPRLMLPVMTCRSVEDLKTTLTTLLQYPQDDLLTALQTYTRERLQTHEKEKWAQAMDSVYEELIDRLRQNVTKAMLRDKSCFLCEADSAGTVTEEIRPVGKFVLNKTINKLEKYFPELPCLYFLGN